MSNQNTTLENFNGLSKVLERLPTAKNNVDERFTNSQNSDCNEKEIVKEANLVVQKSLSGSKLKIQHTILLEVEKVPDHFSNCKKTNDFTTKNNMQNFTQYDKTQLTDHLGSNEMNENFLNRMPSDDTEVLIATMGFKTDLAHPLIINDKTIIKIPNDTLVNKTHCTGEISSKTYIVNNDQINQCMFNGSTQLQTNDECLTQNPRVSITNNYIENQPKEGDVEKENEESSAKIHLLTQNYLEELEEIQPPSFLCSDSIQESLQNDSVHNVEPINSQDENLLKEVSEKDSKITSQADQSIDIEDEMDDWSLLLKNIKLIEQRLVF